MKSHDAVEKISQAMIADGLCRAIFLKGSMGRGEEDAYSDVDLYVVVKDESLDLFLSRWREYLKSYLPAVMVQEVNHCAPQLVAVFEDGLHFDLYAVTADALTIKDSVKTVYDPENLSRSCCEQAGPAMSCETLAKLFEDALYYFVEADAAYHRKNYPWTARILSAALSNSAILLRWLYDPKHAEWGLKGINCVLPSEQYQWLLVASEHLNCPGFQTANNYILKALEFVAEQVEPDIRARLNLCFLDWMRQRLNVRLFA